MKGSSQSRVVYFLRKDSSLRTPAEVPTQHEDFRTCPLFMKPVRIASPYFDSRGPVIEWVLTKRMRL